MSLLSILAVAAAFALLTWLPFGGYIDRTLIEASLSVAVVRFPLAIVALFLSLRGLDYVSGIGFKAEFGDLSNAKALYLAARFIGVAILLAAVFG